FDQRYGVSRRRLISYNYRVLRHRLAKWLIISFASHSHNLFATAIDGDQIFIYGDRLSIFHSLDPVLAGFHANLLGPGTVDGDLVPINGHADFRVIDLHDQRPSRSGNAKDRGGPFLDFGQAGGLGHHETAGDQEEEEGGNLEPAHKGSAE